MSLESFLNLLIIFTYLGNAFGDCPPIITRSEWGAHPALSTSLGSSTTHVVLHHSATPTCATPTNCAALVRSIQKIHMRVKHYPDIGFNFLIGEDGYVYEGVGWGKQGTHAADSSLDSRSLGICMIGDYTSWIPNDAAMDALKGLIECGVQQGHLRADYKLITHRQLEHTDCPGRTLHNHVRAWDHWVAGP